MSSTSFPVTSPTAADGGELPGQWLIDQLHGYRRDSDRRRLSALMAAEVTPFALTAPASSAV